MRKNIVKQKLKNDEPAVGAWLSLGSAHAAEYLANAGFDWLVVDTQHGFFEYRDMIQSFQAISSTSTVPMARVAANETFLINRCQDAGAMGVIIPMINSPQDAKKAVDAARHGQGRNRSAGGGRAMFYDFAGETYHEFMKWSDKETMVVVMIEQKAAVDNIESILSVEGVDACFIGPFDLAISMGTRIGEPDHERAIEKILEGAKATDTPAGIFGLGIEDVNNRLKQGFKFISIGSDTGFLKQASEEVFSKLEI